MTLTENQYTGNQYTGPREFVHLHAHTIFSAMDGIALPEQYAQRCVDYGYPAMSVTEHGHMGSVPDMYLSFRNAGVKFIPACEIYFNDFEPTRQQLVRDGIKVRSRDWREAHPLLASQIGRNRHLTVLAKNEVGYRNLVMLTTQAYKTGLFGLGRAQYNRIWFDKLCEHKEGLIILSGCLNGPVAHELRFTELHNKQGEVVFERSKKDGLREATKYIKRFKEEFGDDYFIELQMPGIPDDDQVFKTLVALADFYDIKAVLTNDCHYLSRKDFILQKIMMATAQNTTVDSPDLFHVNSDEQFMKTRAELWEFFKNNGYSDGIDDRKFEEICDNTLLVADKCKPLELDTSPKIPNIENADETLRQAVAKALHNKGLVKRNEKYIVDGREVTYVEQAKIELNRFIDKGYASYFLITGDLVAYGRKNGWPFSPRGSAGGSLVCYLLGIHKIDPLAWGLSFDRFLSPSRGGYQLNVTMPEPI